MKIYKLFLFSALILMQQLAMTQEGSKLGLQLREHLENSEPETLIPLLLEGDPELVPTKIASHSGLVRLQINELFSVEVPAAAILELSRDPAILHIEFDQSPAHFLTDTMLVQTRTDLVQQMASPLRQKYTGKGVILGVIDSGIELDHYDFKDSLGRSRVLYVWDQGVAYDPGRKPGKYNYGVEWDSTDINQQISTHDDLASEFGHGSMVTGAAASNGLATGHFKGIAPEVNIISVATDFTKPNWLQTVAEAVDYIYSKADSLNMPCVINASIGTYLGSHDGKDIAARMIDQMIKARSGRALVAAAGNAGQYNFHLQHQPQQDTIFSWMSYESQFFNGQGGVYFQLWGDTADLKDLKFAIGTDRKVGNYHEFRGRTAFDSIQNRLNMIYTDSIVNSNNQRITYVQTYAEQSQGRYLLEVALPQPDSNQYLFRLESCGQGKFDLWSSRLITGTSDILEQNLPSPAQYHAMNNYVYPDSLQSMVSSFTCLPSVITVGNYINRSSWVDVQGMQRSANVIPGEISPNSSLGPNREGYLKPDISSAGDYMFSAGRLATIITTIQTAPEKIAFDSLHMRNGGTSMAAPTVAGMVALYFQKCPKKLYSSIKSDLLSSSRTDAFSTSAPNNKWGAGKADALAFLSNSIFQPPFQPSFLPEYCNGDTAYIPVLQAYSNYKWNNGDTGYFATLTHTDTVFARVFDGLCWGVSDTVSILFRPSPPRPNLTQRSDSLIAQVSGNYRWYYNGNQISGQQDSIIVVSQSGEYYAEVIGLYSCVSTSDTINYISTLIEESELNNLKIYPNPAREELQIEFSGSLQSVSLFDLSGRHLLSRKIKQSRQPIHLKVGHLNRGFYILQLEGPKSLIRQKILLW